MVLEIKFEKDPKFQKDVFFMLKIVTLLSIRLVTGLKTKNIEDKNIARNRLFFKRNSFYQI